MSLSRFVNLQFNSSLARRALSLLYKPGTDARILFGPLRGFRFHYDRTVNYHAVLGLWDVDIFELLEALRRSGNLVADDGTVADVGANLGYYTLWLSRFAVPRGRVHAFEPNPHISSVLRSNAHKNACSNVEVVEAACGDRAGTVEFFVGKHHHSSSLHEDWASEAKGAAERIVVSMTTLDHYFAPETELGRPAFVKMDIEGGGTYALPGAARLLADDRPLVLIESHTPDEDGSISNVLTRHGYQAYRLNTKSWVARPRSTYPDREGVWGTMLLVPEERHAAVAAVIAS